MSGPFRKKNTTVEGTKSMPRIELASPILAALSDHSFASYKSFNTVNEREIQKPTEIRSSVKALIDKHKSFQENLLHSKVNCSDQKSFANSCENVCASKNVCEQMKGDTKQIENVEDVVNNHVFETFTDNRMANSPKFPEAGKRHDVLNSENIDYKTGTPERFWQNLYSVVRVNNVYCQFLKEITDTKKFKCLEDITSHVNWALKIAGDDTEAIGSELVASSREFMETFRIALDSNPNEKFKRTRAPPNDDSTTNALREELAENKRRTKIAENNIAQLQKEKKDLLNILTSYDSENIHKVSLEKRLEAEQQKNNELRDLISNIFNKKMPFNIT